MRIGTNGFGRIGRNVATALFKDDPEAGIAAANDLTSTAEHIHTVGEELAPDVVQASLSGFAWEAEEGLRSGR